MLEETPDATFFCNVCAHEWGSHSNSVTPSPEPRTPIPGHRDASIEDLIARSGVRRDELATLAEIGALNSLGYDRRSALWQIERAVRPAGELFAGREEDGGRDSGLVLRQAQDDPERSRRVGTRASGLGVRMRRADTPSPLRPMSPPERLMADYAGTSLTIGPHPMALRRAEFALRGVLRAVDLPRGRHGRRVRVAGAVITRQRPGTAKGFVFLTLEDETGIANIIVRPDLFSEYKQTIVGAPYLLVEGLLQIQEGVTSVKAERVFNLTDTGPEVQSHDFR